MIFRIRIIFLLVLLATPSVAQEPSTNEKQQLLDRLTTLLQADGLIVRMMDAMADHFTKNIPGEIVEAAMIAAEGIEELSVEEEEALRLELLGMMEGVGKRLQQALTTQIDLDRLEKQVSSELYGKFFDEAELRELVAFYSSPTGKKLVSITPALFGGALEKIEELAGPRMTEIITEFMEDETNRLKLRVREKLRDR